MIFTPGQMLVHQEVGSGETAYDTTGMVVAKRRSDLFRHWLLGFGSGDLLVKTAGAQSGSWGRICRCLGSEYAKERLIQPLTFFEGQPFC